jgi:chromosome segregation ATPase
MSENEKLVSEGRVRVLGALLDASEDECERIADFLGRVLDALEAAEQRIRAEVATSDRLRVSWREDVAAVRVERDRYKFDAENLVEQVESAEQRIKELEDAIKRAKPLLRHDSTSAKCFEAIQVLASVVK